MRIHINSKELSEVVECESDGLSRLKPGRREMTEPWRELGRVGLATKDINDDFTGKFVLYVRRGNIRNSDVPKIYKEAFKSRVLPSIYALADNCPESFELELHYSQRLLLDVFLEYKESN